MNMKEKLCRKLSKRTGLCMTTCDEILSKNNWSILASIRYIKSNEREIYTSDKNKLWRNHIIDIKYKN